MTQKLYLTLQSPLSVGGGLMHESDSCVGEDISFISGDVTLLGSGGSGSSGSISDSLVDENLK